MKDENDNKTVDLAQVAADFAIPQAVLEEALKAAGAGALAATPEAVDQVITGRRFAKSKTPDAIRQKWRTPKWLFNYADHRWGPFARDVAAEAGNALCAEYIDEQQNALDPQVAWGKEGETVWCNPPYADPIPWVAAAARNAKQHGVTTVMLLNHDHSPQWFYDMIQACSEIVNIMGYYGTDAKGEEKFHNGRVAFVNAATEVEGRKNSKASSLFLIKPRKRGPVKTDYLTKQDMLDASASVL